ncbi:MAG: GIY-YIG nuclease family protein [Candidatus Spechtbacterales bacterium]
MSAMNKNVSIEKIKELPQKPGVYFLKNKNGDVFYIGKAINIKSRVQNHKNNSDLFKPEKIHTVEWVETVNEIEALLKESEYIKKLNPKMNIRLRDDKKYFYVGITGEDLPRIFITHQPLNKKQGTRIQETNKSQITNSKQKAKSQKLKAITYLGPYTDGGALKLTLKYLRRLFPYYTTNPKRPLSAKKHGKLLCSYCHLGLCPGPEPKKSEYLKSIKVMKQILKGRKKSVISALKKEMKENSRLEKFEKAAELRNIAQSVENIFSHNTVLPWNEEVSSKRTDMGTAEYLANLVGSKKPIHSIEGYDISNIQGKEPTASMVRFQNGKPEKNLYRKFNIKSPDEPNDYLMMREVVRRRLKNNWPLPDLMLIDGGRGQLNSVLVELRSAKVNIHAVSLAKREEELYLPKQVKPIPLNTMPSEVENLLRYARDEAHRFAVSHHRQRHRKKFQ